jgi:transcriptional regulator with XRE-family HTH domain
VIADTIAAVGPRLKALRVKRDVTLAALAQATGISASTLSRLESGQRKATLELLLSLSTFYGVTVDDLVGTPPTVDPRIVATPFTKHGRTYFPLSRRPGGVQAFRTVVHAGAGPEPVVPRTHEGYEWLYVLSGRLHVVLGDTDLVLSPGEVVELDTRVPHFFGRATADAVEFLSLFGKQGERMHVRATGA